MKIKEYTIGKTRVKIHDDCIAKTAEEVDNILNRCGQIVAENIKMQQERCTDDVIS